MITLTDSAQEKIAEFVKEAGDDCRGVRIRAARVGKYTFRYQIHLVRDQDMEDDDSTIDLDRFAVVIDPQSDDWMNGSTVDFLTLDSRSGIQIDNPAAPPRGMIQ